MKKSIIVFILLIGIIIGACQQDGPPQAEITNGILTAHLYLPDADEGYYKAVRFDWSGQISSLEYEGHNYYGQWYEKVIPEASHTIMGPVEEFGPLSYDIAKPGDNFVKIGVGVLTRISDSIFDKHIFYPLVDPGKWKIREESDNIQFTHVLNSEINSYEYTKSITLLEGKAVMQISHILKNTGEKTIETNVLNHNFFVIDNQTTGTGFEVTFPVDVTGEGKGMPDVFDFHGNKLIFKRDLVKGEAVFCESVEGFTNKISDYDILIENIKTGAGARITGDRPISYMHFWANYTTICPEPYVDIKVEPGEEFSWNYFYEFYISPK